MSIMLLLTFMALLRPSHAVEMFDLLPRGSSSCPGSYKSCGGKLPSDFCCPSSSTCISLDDATSAICCPAGSNCDYISPITCDVQEQNTAVHRTSSIKTTRLKDTLPTCGDACCPFGYSCAANSTCILDKKTATPETTNTSSSTTDPTTAATFTPVPSPSTSASSETVNSLTTTASCPSFPSKAVIAGFFPGALFGAVAALLVSLCLRRRSQKKEQQIYDPKTGKAWSQRSSSGAVMGISSPIASEDYSTRTDFLLRPGAAKRSSLGAHSTRSMLHRTGSKMRGLFSNGGHRLSDETIPPVPTAYPVTPPRQRQPSTESIKVYSPPGAFAQSRKFLGPEPYPSTIARPDTTFTDLMQVVGFNDSKGNPKYKVTGDEKC